MFLGVSVTVADMEIEGSERQVLAGYIRERRKQVFGTKSAAYRAAGLNSTTWDRIEQGQTGREDTLRTAVRALWPETGGDWRQVIAPTTSFSGPVFGGSYDDPNYLQNIEKWVSELQDRIESLEAAVFETGGESSAQAPEPEQGAGGPQGSGEDGAPGGRGTPIAPRREPEPESMDKLREMLDGGKRSVTRRSQKGPKSGRTG